MSPLVVSEAGISPFTGGFHRRVEQFRVTLPGHWRQASTIRTFAVVLWPLGEDQHLVALPPRRWEKMVAELRDQPLSDEEHAWMERILGMSVAWSDLDNAGRLTLPEQHFVRAGIGPEVELIGRLDKFELWNPARYEQLMLEQRKTAASIAKKLRL